MKNIIKRNERGYCSRKADGWTGARSVQQEPEAQGGCTHGAAHGRAQVVRGWKQPDGAARWQRPRRVKKAHRKRHCSARKHTVTTEEKRHTSGAPRPSSTSEASPRDVAGEGGPEHTQRLEKRAVKQGLSFGKVSPTHCSKCSVGSPPERDGSQRHRVHLWTA